MNPKSPQRLRDARDHVRLSLEALEHFGDALEHDAFASLALQRSVDVMGEALPVISETDPQTVQNHPEIPWKPAIRLRTRLAHGYSNIEMDFLSETVRAEFPDLLDKLNAALALYE